jgi:hypothetical protein
VDVADETSRAVPALLDFAAIGVEDAVIKIGLRVARALDLEDLVAADAEMAIRDEPKLLSRERERLFSRVEHDEIVAEAVHLGETYAHIRFKYLNVERIERTFELAPAYLLASGTSIAAMVLGEECACPLRSTAWSAPRTRPK